MVTFLTTRLCPKCNIEQSLDNFYLRKDSGNYRLECKQCFNKYMHKKRSELSSSHRLYIYSRDRAAKNNIEFNITVEDIEAVNHKICPVLGIELDHNYSNGTGRKLNSVSLDRINPSKGYVKGNICVISFKANKLKSNANLEDIEMLAAYLRKWLPRDDSNI